MASPGHVTLLLVVLAVSAVPKCLHASSSDLGLTCDSPILVDSDEWSDSNTALQLALNDLRQDWTGQLSCRPAILTDEPPTPAPSGSLSANITSVVIGTKASKFIQQLKSPQMSQCQSGWETHCLLLVDDPWFGGKTIVATAADRRGLLFAVYSVSELVLGRGPFDYFLGIDYEPTQLLMVDTGIFPAVYDPPTFKYRAFFPNDEDLFGGFQNDPLGRSVWSIEIWDHLYSAILRVKANTVLVGTNVFPDNVAYRLAARRGLTITSHHYNILGLSPVAQGVATWFPEEYNFQLRPDAMMYGWKGAVRAQLDYPEVLWTVGYRGAGDTPATCYGPCTIKDKASHVSWAVANETAMVRSMTDNPQFLTWLWAEGLSYLESGAFKIPEDTIVVFADSGDGNVKGLEYATSGAGIYTHVAMLDGHANQLTEMVPVSRIFGSITTFVKKNVTSIFILNVSDQLPYIMTTLANFRGTYDWKPFQCDVNVTGQCQALQDKWISQFAKDTFRMNTTGCDIVSSAYRAYFNVPYIADGNADDLLSNLVREAADTIVPSDSQNQTLHRRYSADYDWAKSSEVLCEAYANVSQLLQDVPATRQQAYRTTVLNSIGYHCLITKALVDVNNATVAFKAKDQDKTMKLLNQARESLDELFAVQRDAEGIRFRGLFGYDDLSCTPRARRAVVGAFDRLRLGQTGAAFGWAFGADKDTCRGYSGMYHYQFGFARQNYPLVEFNATSNMNLWPQVYCVYDDGTKHKAGDDSWCLPNPDGGSFKSNATIIIKTVNNTYPVRYTMDGSTPSKSSPIAHGPINITNTTTFQAILDNQDYLAPHNPPTVARFVKVA